MAQKSDFFEDDFKLTSGGKAATQDKSILKEFLNSSGLRGRLSNPNYVKDIYSGKPEAVVKVIGYTRGYKVKAVLDYISRIDSEKKKDVECETELSTTLKGEKQVFEVYDRWKKDFDPYSNKGLTRKKRDAAHIMLSAGSENTEKNAEKVLAAAREVMKTEFYDKGYEFVGALHRDSGNLHIHFVIKCKNRFQGQPKLRINQPEIFNLRTQFAKKLTELGLDHVSTLRKDRPDIVTLVNQGVDRLEKNETQYQRAMKRVSPSRDSFVYRKNASTTITRLRDQVKKDKDLSQKKRRELLTALRSIERKITKNRPGIENEIAASFRKNKDAFGKFNQAVAGAAKVPRKDKKKIDDLIKSEFNKIEKSMVIAKLSIKESNATNQAKKDSLFVLAQYENDMKKALTRGVVVYREPGEEKAVQGGKKGVSFGINLGINESFKPLNETVKTALSLYKENPETAVGRLGKRRELERLTLEIKKEIKAAREELKLNAFSPGFKNEALTSLRDFEKTVFDKLQGKETVKKQTNQTYTKKRDPRYAVLYQQKKAFEELKKQKPTTEQDKIELNARIVKLGGMIKKEVGKINREIQGEQARKKQREPQNKLEKMKTLYSELKKQQPQGEKRQEVLKNRLGELERSIKNEIKEQRKGPQVKTTDSKGKAKEDPRYKFLNEQRELYNSLKKQTPKTEQEKKLLKERMTGIEKVMKKEIWTINRERKEQQNPIKSVQEGQKQKRLKIQEENKKSFRRDA